MAVDRILRKGFWALLLALVVAAAFLDARAVGHLVGVVLAPEPARLALASLVRQQEPAPAAESHATSARALLSRNPFDSQTGALDAEPLEGTNLARAPADLGDPMNAPACDDVKVLIITQAENPDWSFAAFGDGSDGADRTILRRRNGDVGDKTIEFVGRDRVWLKTANARCQAKLFDPAEPVKPAAMAAAASTLDPALVRGIKKTGPNEYDLDRAVIDRIIDNQADLLRATRIVPEPENGRTVGIRLFGVKEGSLLGILGLQNGDRLQQINGYDMSSPEKMLEAYARLRGAEHLTLQVNRRGAIQSLDYTIK